MADLTFTGLDGNVYPLITAGGKASFRRDKVTEEHVNVVVPASGPVRFVPAGEHIDDAYSINGIPVSQRTWLASYPPSWSSGKGSGGPAEGNV